MTFLFAYLGSLSTPPGWPLHLIYLTEATFVILAFVCGLIAMRWRGRGPQPWRDAVAFVGGVSVTFGLIMPFELAPMFFGVRGEWMMLTIGLNLVYPIAAVLFILGFSKFMKGDRPSDARVDLLSATSCYDRGVVCLQRKDYDHAIADFTEAIRHNPRFAAAYHDRGAAYLDKSDYDHAIADYDQAIALNPKLTSAYSNRGKAYRANGELDRANADFDRANTLMRDAEQRSHPQRNADRSGVMGVFAEWLNNRAT